LTNSIHLSKSGRGHSESKDLIPSRITRSSQNLRNDLKIPKHKEIVIDHPSNHFFDSKPPLTNRIKNLESQGGLKVFMVPMGAKVVMEDVPDPEPRTLKKVFDQNGGHMRSRSNLQLNH
jgi:hypothetical protein